MKPDDKSIATVTAPDHYAVQAAHNLISLIGEQIDSRRQSSDRLEQMVHDHRARQQQ
jgi:hypothetical protein